MFLPRPYNHSNHNMDTNGADTEICNTHLPEKPELSPTLISDTELLSEFSHHAQNKARINNGSFGCCPKSVLSAQQKWQLEFLKQPDDYYFNRLKDGIFKSRLAIKELVNADHIDEISIVDNATTAIAIVLQSVAWEFLQGKFNKGDAAVTLQYAYGAVKKSLEAYIMRADGKVRLAMIDHVTSIPSVLIPVKELIKVCREDGVDKVFVDGAHGIGCVDVDVKEMGADFYTRTLNKWFFCPPAAAILYCRKSSEVNDLHHPVVSHEYGNGLPIESAWIGTRDYSAQLVIPQALEFVNRFEGGIEGIKKRNHKAVVEMGKMLAKAWGTHLGSPPEMCSSMIMVGLPASLGISSDSIALKLSTHLRNNFCVDVRIYYREPGDGMVNPVTGYARISHHVYNKPDDYYKFRDAVNQLVNDEFTCALLS
ncbi:putative L-cysteine desulfhydrase [Citrus sinensis]|uniref:L-cysteine desulfhydrase n=1 Tax=Citrus sinensis TaxID=2711 RepID=A0ACB8JQ14_CITSI|nr:putative L-cysteine desulfhydrase [Citrus sinensis]